MENKLAILSDAAKYDVSCASSGSEHQQVFGSLGTTHFSDICHAFSADGRCISLLKILLTNSCIHDCAYCINRRSNERERAAKPLLLREHHLYQADWLMRYYGFGYDEILSATSLFLDERFDPKLAWALRNLRCFPVAINRVERETLLRVPGFGIRSVQKILRSHRRRALVPEDLATLKISLKKARYFITIGGKPMHAESLKHERLESRLPALCPGPVRTCSLTLRPDAKL